MLHLVSEAFGSSGAAWELLLSYTLKSQAVSGSSSRFSARTYLCGGWTYLSASLFLAM